MSKTQNLHHSIGEQAAFQLANVTKTAPQYSIITPPACPPSRLETT